MSHEGNTAALGSTAKEGDPGPISAQLLCEIHHGIPGCSAAGVFMILHCAEVCTKSSVCLHSTSKPDLEQRHCRRAEMPARSQLARSNHKEVEL